MSLKQKAHENAYRIAAVFSALSVAPKPPANIPSNVCSTNCNACEKRWYEDTITMFRCQCSTIRVCPLCAKDMLEPRAFEHNLVDCNYDEQ